MRKLSENFRGEIVSINWQFAIFLVAYFFRFLENVFYLVTEIKFEGFGGAAFMILGNLLDHILPASFVLY